MNSAGKIAVVTGASSGLGRAVAREFRRRGFTVIALCRHAPEADTADRFLAVDLTDAEQRTRAAAAIEQEFGRLDVLVNNAGIGSYATWEELSEDSSELSPLSVWELLSSSEDEPEDRLLFCSDGVTQAGMGSPEYKLGWRREGLIEFVLHEIERDKTVSSTHLAHNVVRAAEMKEPGHKAKDDISCSVLYFRKPRKMLLFTGPPYYSERDAEYAKIFDDFDGKKAISGGTTANLLARELGRTVVTERFSGGSLPACSKMEGVDLVTEGILTLTKAVEYLNDDCKNMPDDAAGKLVNMFLDSDCIDFMVGTKLNQAHYDPDLPVELAIRKNVVKQLEKILSERYIKKVHVQYI